MKKDYFKPVKTNVNFPEIEKNIIDFWKKENIFSKSISNRPEDKTWTFLDGPPFITGLPHYGTLLSSIPKDIFGRYFTMKGYRVRRVWGWDCHGLPAENKVEAEFGIKRKKDIENKVGVKKFIDACKSYVQNVSSEWEWYVDHIGRWVDFRRAYKTMDRDYMETVMWVFKNMYDKGYIYKGLRVSLYCPHCSTPISNFEVAMDQDNYQNVTESATTYKYKLTGTDNTYILAWSTTPWNKIATPALAVNPKLDYVTVSQNNQKYILAEKTLKMLNDDPYQIEEKFKGAKLLGVKFEPHYDFYKIDPGKKAFIIVGGDFVTALDGTGVVTIAAYGEDDLKVMQKENIQIVEHIDDEGILKSDVPNWAGMYYLNVNPLVNHDLFERGLIYRDDKLTHSIPTCWRCHTRLIFAPQDAWYVDIQKLKPALKKTNKSVNWFPKHFKFGRYLKSLESAPDWCISRSRFWGSPVPVWECSGCGQRFVPGSISELETLSGQKVEDLHKPEIDEVTIKCGKCGQIAKRVSEVLDSWIEAGSASFAERHYPFDKSIHLEEFFPPDFIVEYTGQIRAWFYVLHVIATSLFNSHAFKNVVVTGVILGTDGRKMSKNYGNYPDPKEMLSNYGGDALRLYLMGSSVMHAEDILISEVAYRNQVKGILLILWNIYNFFMTYALIDKWQPDKKISGVSDNILDKWLVSMREQTLSEVTDNLDKFDTVKAINKLQLFIENFSQWYIRRSRNRVGPAVKNQADKNNFYATAYRTLIVLTQMLAPLMPFISEEIYKNLTGEESVHLSDWPKVNLAHINQTLENEMVLVRRIVESAHASRKLSNIKVRQPLSSLTVNLNGTLHENLLDLIKDEINVKEVIIKKSKTLKIDSGRIPVKLDTKISKELAQEGRARDLARQIQQLRKDSGCGLNVWVNLILPSEFQELPAHLLDGIKSQTLVKSVIWGERVEITTGS